MTAPFLSIVTRCCRRPRMLRLNVLSVLAQTCRDWEQVFLVDEEGGHRDNVLWANRQFKRHRSRLAGRYVFILDDDGVLWSPDFVARAREAAASGPDVVLCRSRQPRAPGASPVLPPDAVWNVGWEKGKRPRRWVGHCYNSVFRADHWPAVCESYWGAKRGGDWRFQTDLLLGRRTEVRRLPGGVYSAMSLQRGRGEVFDPLAGLGWFGPVARELGLEEIGKGAWRLRP